MVKTKSKRRGLSLRRREMFSGYLFIAPWLIGVTYFFLFNLIRSGIFSVNDISMAYSGIETINVGLDNFRFVLLEHGSFNRVLVDSLFEIFVLRLPLIIFFSLLMAVLLNQAFAGRGLVRAIFFLPVIMATTAIQGPLEHIMAMMLGGISSLPPEVVREAQGFNATAITFMLADFGMPMQVVEFIVEAIAQLHDIIRASGVQILIFLAALQAIPTSMYEVAQIEGATGYEIFWKITIPLVSPLILTNVVYTVVDTYARSNAVDLARLTAFTFQQFGRSSAMSIISSVAVILIMGFVMWLISKRVFYYN